MVMFLFFNFFLRERVRGWGSGLGFLEWLQSGCVVYFVGVVVYCFVDWCFIFVVEDLLFYQVWYCLIQLFDVVYFVVQYDNVWVEDIYYVGQ